MYSLVKNILFLLMVSLAIGCHKSDDTRLYHIGFSQCADDVWRVKMNQDMVREAMFYGNIDLEIRTANGNNAQQIADIQYFIEKRVDLLIVSPNTSEVLTPVIEQAHNAGIKIIVADRKVFTDSYDAFIGADNYQIGQAVGNYLSVLLPQGGNIVEICGIKTSSPAIERHEGFINLIKGCGIDFRLLATLDGQWNKSTACESMLAILEEYPDIDVVFAHNDEMASGAYEAAQSVGRERDIKFIGIDALHGAANGVGMVAADILSATFMYPNGVEKIFQQAMALLSGEPVARESILSTAIIDKSNVRVMELQGDYIVQQDIKIERLNDMIGTYAEIQNRQRISLYISVVFICIIFVALLGVVVLLRSKNRLNRELMVQKDNILKQNQLLEEQRDKLIELSCQVEDSTQAKLQFFTNISHEIRTPLTLIADPLKRLMSGNESETSERYLLSLINYNVDILLRLVNQILEFRRYENGKTEMTKSEVNMREIMLKWNDSFLHMFRRKNIAFNFNAQSDIDYNITIDVNKIEQVYYNLLNNAFKYTPENGKIKVSLDSCQEGLNKFLQVSIFNSGAYISPVDIDKIFDRFYQVSEQSAGSGIGLAIVRAFIDMHKGTIRVVSNQDSGTTFIIRLPQSLEMDDASASNNTLTEMSDEVMTEAMTSDKPVLLIVDDNDDICSYISNSYSDKFAVLTAANGGEGLKIAYSVLPDVIILDVMMPGMNGLECCEQLKNDIRTSHIPVIMLTARSADIQRVEGYECGADSYITKPFTTEVLSARIHNLLENRRRMQQRILEGGPVNDDSNLGKKKDNQFIEKLNEYINANIDNVALEVRAIGSHMAMSRMQFYRKLKVITGLSPNEYVRMIRLKRATELMLDPNKSISDICYETGFSSPSYFAKCFKNYMGVSPNDYKRKVNNNERVTPLCLNKTTREK